jgi:hypothetical protein
MKSRTKRLGAAVLTLVAVVVLAFGGNAAYVSATTSFCDPGQSGYLGECPPYDDMECNEDCKDIFGDTSEGNGCIGGCCFCATR